MTDEFPPELEKRCAKSFRDVPPYSGIQARISAVLRESGHAQLVAALEAAKKALWVYSLGDDCIEINKQIDAALAKSGYPKGGS